jgi:hypothetical protein
VEAHDASANRQPETNSRGKVKALSYHRKMATSELKFTERSTRVWSKVSSENWER